MSELLVQEVEFNGSTLVAVKSPADEKVYVGVSWVCEGIGLTEKQRDRQVANVQSDLVLSSGVKKLPLKYGGKVRNAVAIELDYLPLWLAKISITPKMIADSPDVVENLIEYRLKARDVLAKAFIEQSPYIVPQNYKEALQHLLRSIEENEALKPKAEFHDKVAITEGSDSVMNVGKGFGIGEKKFFQFLRSVGILFMQDGINVPKQQYQNQGYFEVKLSLEKSEEGERTSYKTRVTGKGKTYLYSVLERFGGASVINSLPIDEIDDYVKNKYEQLMKK